ncbi:MAG: glutaredoxin 2 [Alphaproteobacteria bacterium]
MHKLYVYDHCPYCTRARMIFGYQNLELDLRFLLNDDEDAHYRMVNKKVVPILEKEDGTYMPESLDIVHYIDGQCKTPLMGGEADPNILEWISRFSQPSYHLSMPRWALSNLAEFATPSARMYFLKKKEAASGQFSEHFENTDRLVNQVYKLLEELVPLIQSPEGVRDKPSIDDIHLFPVLRGLTIVKNMPFPQEIRDYLVRQSELTRIWLFDAFAL